MPARGQAPRAQRVGGVALAPWPATADPLAALRARFAAPDAAGDDALRLLASRRHELAEA